MNTICKPKFNLGQVVATPGALEILEESGQSPDFFLEKHQRGDWGDICEEDKGLNDQSLIDGSRLLSVYKTLLGKKLWVITEAVGDDGKRSVSTILTPDEY
jgi:hypothetical protein